MSVMSEVRTLELERWRWMHRCHASVIMFWEFGFAFDKDEPTKPAASCALKSKRCLARHPQVTAKQQTCTPCFEAVNRNNKRLKVKVREL